MAVTTTRRAIVRMSPGAEPAARPDDLAVEDPLVLGLHGEAIATLMRTPGHDLELAAGWLVERAGFGKGIRTTRLAAGCPPNMRLP